MAEPSICTFATVSDAHAPTYCPREREYAYSAYSARMSEAERAALKKAQSSTCALHGLSIPQRSFASMDIPVVRPVFEPEPEADAEATRTPSTYPFTVEPSYVYA